MIRAFLISLFVLSACDDNIATPPPFIHGPADSVVSGPLTPAADGATPSYVFVSGQEKNLVYTIDLTNLQWVQAPNQYFPNEIPVCETPTGISTTPDNRFVVVLCATSKEVQVIDTTSLLRVRDSNNVPVSIPVGLGGTRLLSRGLDPVTGDARFVAENAGDNTLTLFHVTETPAATSGGPASFGSMAVDQTLTLPVNIDRGALNSDASVLYANDLTTTLIHAISLPSGNIVDYDMQHTAVDVVFDGKNVIAATPETTGLTVVDGATGAIVDTKPIYAPLIADTDAYPGIYIGEVPRRLAFINQGGPLVLDCATLNNSAELDDYTNSMIVVVADTGPAYFVDDAKLQVISTTGAECQEPSVAPTNSTPVTGDIPGLFTSAFQPFEPCPANLPNRFECAFLSDGESGNVIVYPGHTGSENTSSFRVVMQWQGTLPNADRRTGGGTLSADGQTITDSGVNLATLPVPAEPGDLVVIASVPSVSPASCQQTYGNEESTQLLNGTTPVFDSLGRSGREIPIQSVNADGSVTLVEPIDTSCFPTSEGQLLYEIVIGNGFLLSSGSTLTTPTVSARVAPGDTYGANNLDLVRFTVKSDLATNPDTAKLLTRGALIDFTAAEAFNPLYGATELDSLSGEEIPVGHGPTSVSLAYSGTSNPTAISYSNNVSSDQTSDLELAWRLVISYGGNDTVALLRAWSTAYISTPSDTAILQ